MFTISIILAVVHEIYRVLFNIVAFVTFGASTTIAKIIYVSINTDIIQFNQGHIMVSA